MARYETGDLGGYPAEMQPVPFPAAEAGEAKAVCEVVAAMLEEHLSARVGMVGSVRDGWEGTYRVEFDETWSVQEARLANLKEDLTRLAADLGNAAADAVTINESRAGLRAEHDLRQQAAAAAAAAGPGGGG